MYSPKIKEDLIHVLYKLAKKKKTPMTRLVDQLLRDSLKHKTLNEIKNDSSQE